MSEYNTDSLNSFLKREEMAVEAFEKFINGIEDDDYLKSEFLQIQQDHKINAEMLQDRIKALGGNSSKGAGIAGFFQNTKQNIQNILDNKSNYEILEEAYNGEKMGIEALKKLDLETLDSNTKKILNNIIEIDKKHIKNMSRMLSTLDSKSKYRH